MYIKDPLEIIEDNIERMLERWDRKSCMMCGIIPDHELVGLDSSPDCLAVCEKCAEKHWNKINSRKER